MQSTTDKNVTLLLRLYRTMFTARTMDLIEQSYTARGEAFFHVSGAGHEGSVALAPHLSDDDWLHCHYRDKALMLERGISSRMFFLSLFNKDASHSRGRQMNAHMSLPERKILSIVGPVGNNALQAVGVAEEVQHRPGSPLVLCALGEGTTQESEVVEAIIHAARRGLPVLFVVHDNRFAISTTTRGQTFYALPDAAVDEFVGVPITRIDGREVGPAVDAFGTVVARIRDARKPEIVVFEVERLHNHTNADDQRVYRNAAEITAAARNGDPVARLRSHLLSAGTISADELAAMEEDIRSRLNDEARGAQRAAEPEPSFSAAPPLSEHISAPSAEYRGEQGGTSTRSITMLEAIRGVLESRLAANPAVTLFGQDIEDPKGDVFGVTKGLSSRFPGRVQNSPLSESLIVGTAIGRALAGGRPVAFLQFADFLPIAYNQIFAELGSMYWRTDGGWRAPVIVMVTAGGYRPGLGPFHASTLEALVAHTPGVDVFMPSNAADAAGLLNAAFDSQRPTIFFYPKNQLNDRSGTTSTDLERQFVPIGRARLVREGDALTLVGWGNTVPLLLHAAETLETHGVRCDLLDLRSLMPWDVAAVVRSVEKTGRLIVAHEDNRSAGFGAEVVATVAENARRPLAVRRVTRPDTYVPCNFGNQLQVLPSYKRILTAAVELLGGQIEWQQEKITQAGYFAVEAVGSSPSDETVTIVRWTVVPGVTVEEGDLLAEVEADKAAAELKSPVRGEVAELLHREGDNVPVGTPVLRVRLDELDTDAPVKTQTREDAGIPLISGMTVTSMAATSTVGANESAAGIVGIGVCTGRRVVPNAEIATLSSGWEAADIEKRTGIATRHWVSTGQTVVSMAHDAVIQLRQSVIFDPQQIRLVLFATGTPSGMTPSMATLLQHQLSAEFGALHCPAYDINAACSGYVYGLQIAHDFLRAEPTGLVLLITSEVLSTRLDLNDAGTAPIFGDAATATLLVGAEGVVTGDSPHIPTTLPVRAWVRRPVLAARGEDGSTLNVPLRPEQPLRMDGPKVYQEAVRAMISTLQQAADAANLDVRSLDLYVPHQANQRIINAVRQRLRLPDDRVYSNIRNNGNTSSSTIPLCLAEILPAMEAGKRIGLTAFGGGFTFGAAILETA